MADEILETAPEETNLPPATVQTKTPPPAAILVVNGEKSEREIELEGLLASTTENLTAAERRALEAERRSAELERDNQMLLEIPPPPKPPKVKREKHWSDPVFSDDEE